MHKEIYEEPKVIIDTVEEVKKGIKDLVSFISNFEKIYIVGSGTSYHASLYFELLFPNSIAIQASEFTKRKITQQDRILVVAISQSGESKDVINALLYAKKLGAKILAITNTLGSTLHRLADKAIVTKAGEEKAIAATKSYIAQLVSIAYLYSVYANKNLEAEILDLPNKIYEIFSMEGIYKKYGEMLNEKIIILGSGVLYPTALEASLKLKETANVVSEAYPSREFLHGPMQILDKNTDVIILGNSEDEMQVVKRVTDYESKIIRVCEDCEIKIPVTNEILKPILYIIPIQFMAFYKALKKGLNPDKPEKLVKVVRE